MLSITLGRTCQKFSLVTLSIIFSRLPPCREMVVVAEEVHGIFQSLTIGEKAYEQGENVFSALETEPGWFFKSELLEAEAFAISNPRFAIPEDFTVAKYQIDLLYFEQKYEEAYQVALKSYIYHKAKNDIKREMVDALVRTLLKVDNKDIAILQECNAWLEERCHVRDTGLGWLRIWVEAGREDWESALKACEEYLEIRHGELEIWYLKRKFLGELVKADPNNSDVALRLDEVQKSIRLIEFNHTR